MTMDTTMELDDLKQAWQTLDRRLERQEAMNLQLFRERRLQTLHSRLRPLAAGQAIQGIAGVLLMVVFAPFWIAHRDSLHLLVYGLSLHAYGLAMVVCAARTFYLARHIDHAAPVLEIQRQLADLRAWQLRVGRWFAIAGCFIWIPMVLVVFYAIGADVWAHAQSVVYWFLASGFACLGLVYALLRFARRPGQERLKRFLDESSIGRSVFRAQAILDEIERFERE
jgi:hypothetical protein